MTYTPADLEAAFEVMCAADIGYWTAYAYALKDGSIEILEDDEDASAVLITPAAFLDWMQTDGPAALINQIGDPYQKAAIADIIAHNWDNWDYDAETGDLILQQMILGEIRYG